MSTSDWFVIFATMGGVAVLAVLTTCFAVRTVLYFRRRNIKAAEAERFVRCVYGPALVEAARQGRTYIDSDGKNDRSRSKARVRFVAAWAPYYRLYCFLPAVRALAEGFEAEAKRGFGIRLVPEEGLVSRLMCWITGEVPTYSLVEIWGWEPPRE